MNNQIVAVCPSIERRDLVEGLVKSWQAVTPEPRPELLVVAMGGDDGTVGWCKNQNVPVLRPPEKLTFARACNLGVRQALLSVSTAEWILLLNNDLVLHESFWAGLNEAVQHGYEIVGAKLLYPDRTIQHYGKVFTLDYWPFHVLRGQPHDTPASLHVRPFPAVTFACVAIHRAVWDGLGGLDEGFENGYEDDDFCLQAREKGAEIGVHPLMLATHLESQTSGKDSANKQVQWEKFHVKWIATNRIIWPLGMFPSWRFG